MRCSRRRWAWMVRCRRLDDSARWVRLGVMSTPAFELRFRVALHDTDAAGVLFFAHLFRHAHDAYEAWMAHLGFPLDAMLRKGELRLPLVHAAADYRRPLRHGDEVTIQLRVADIGESAFTIEYRFLADTGERAATARSVHVGLGADERRGLPQPLRDALAQFGRGDGATAKPGVSTERKP